MFKYVVPKFPAANVKASVEFYKSKLGFVELFGSMSFRVERDAVISASPARMGWPAGA